MVCSCVKSLVGSGRTRTSGKLWLRRADLGRAPRHGQPESLGGRGGRCVVLKNAAAGSAGSSADEAEKLSLEKSPWDAVRFARVFDAVLERIPVSPVNETAIAARRRRAIEVVDNNNVELVVSPSAKRPRVAGFEADELVGGELLNGGHTVRWNAEMGVARAWRTSVTLVLKGLNVHHGLYPMTRVGFSLKSDSASTCFPHYAMDYGVRFGKSVHSIRGNAVSVYKYAERVDTLRDRVDEGGRVLEGTRLLAKCDSSPGTVSFCASSPSGKEEGAVSIPMDDLTGRSPLC